MTIEEIKKYFEDNKDSEDVKQFLADLAKAPELTLGVVQQFLTDNEDGKKFLQSHVDAAVTKGIGTWKENNLKNLVDDAVKKANPEETDEQKRIRTLEDKFNTTESELVREKLKNKTVAELSEKGLPTELADFFIGRDEERTTANLKTFETVFEAAVKKEVEKKFKKGGDDFNKGDNDKNKNVKNPWKTEHFNLTEQGRISKEDPELAKKLKAAAGK